MSSNVERRTVDNADFQLRAEGEELSKPVISGLASVFDSPTFLLQSPSLIIRETIKPGAFAKAIAEQQDVRALVDHDSSQIIGRTRAGTLKLTENATGLFVEITPPDTQLARDLIENIRVGNITQMSFAFRPRTGGETVTTRLEQGVTYTDIEITDVDLYDVSVVTYPAYADTVCSVRAQEILAQQNNHDWLAPRRLKLALLEAMSK